MQQNDEPAVNRRLVALHESSTSALAYGCSVCYWRFEPKVVSELYEAATVLSAQVLFGTHDCHRFKAPKYRNAFWRETKGTRGVESTRRFNQATQRTP
jgi:G:T-mismatch repair DNA endonuclease (very short patch repair protein)